MKCKLCKNEGAPLYCAGCEKTIRAIIANPGIAGEIYALATRRPEFLAVGADSEKAEQLEIARAAVTEALPQMQAFAGAMLIPGPRVQVVLAGESEEIMGLLATLLARWETANESALEALSSPRPTVTN